MATLPEADDHKIESDKKEQIASDHDYQPQTASSKHITSPKIKRKKSKTAVDSVLDRIPAKKREMRKVEIPPLTRICLDVMYQNLTQYDNFDFLPQDLAIELFLMVTDRQQLNDDTARPFLRTKHELIVAACNKFIKNKRLPPQYRYGCRGI